MKQEWLRAFPALNALAPETAARLAEASSVVSRPAGARIYAPGQTPTHYLLLLDGSVRVQQVSESGREIVLYRVGAGESCTLTTACLLGTDDYPAEAIAETDVRAVTIPKEAFDEAVSRSAEFRRFVFGAISARLASIFHLVEEVAFARLDIRLAHKLLELSHGGPVVSVTQQQLAAELGTAREVVSRTLSEFNRRGWVTTLRGTITLEDRRALEALAGTA
jgi:CRP/FNR family transcriptional regulator